MNALDRVFRVSLILKGLDGILELVGGVLALIISPTQLSIVMRALTQHELSEDPNDFIANHLIQFADSLTLSASVFAAIYLLLHGAVKIVLVLAVLLDRLWAFPWMIAFLLVFILYQVYEISISFSIWLLLLTLFDLFITWLTIVEYRKRRRNRAT
ncbi:MAG: DUF2127 domain-containing protein [Actinomycetota bacterium]